ncbi:acetyltransferase [Xanthomonas campestris pv. raphani]|uniref:acetyltransferase n=1 Tax=Xanthomonas TaxID=338 RepID=UPI001E550E55|nr:acetyltransferase [Xanthomonas campestris]MCC5089606.1 acetyltransferase [Xanthomonas campestris]MEA9606967.1 acetyltransferase [Xanthomonas campestris pv. plantaginis]MEA9752027.1 acetyltransferase [Xanthomonas campestris pv. raphani]MEA9811556.1 acetyltransferase [Xanthomonas campestris pv. raphani]
MTRQIVAGTGWALDTAFELAGQLGLEPMRLPLTSTDGYNFDISSLRAEHPSEDTAVFVALDERAINYARQSLIAVVRLAGYRTFNLVSPSAVVEPGVRLMGNVLVGPGCSIASGCTLGMGSWLDRQVVLDRDVKLGSCVSLRAGVLLAEQVQIGTGSTLSAGSIACARTQVGKHCEWLLGGQLPAALADRSFFDGLLVDGARILQ